MRGSILTVGDSTVDHFLRIDDKDAELMCRLKQKECEICFNYGEKIPVKTLTSSYGGSALNCAIGFGKLKIEAFIATHVGQDVEGKGILSYLRENGIETKYVKTDATTNQAAIILYRGERTILSFHKPRNYDELEIPSYSWIYFASAGQGCERLKSRIVELADSGSNIIFNPGSWELKNFEKFAPVFKRSLIVILNRDEARMVIEDTHDVKKQLEKIIKFGPKIAVITDGAAGVYISFLGNHFHQSSLAVKVVDTTGAGDAFSVGFCAGLIQGKSIEESAKWGIINSSSVIESVGANTGLLTAEEIEKKMNSSKILKFKKI